MERIVKVGQMPGRITEVVCQDTTTISEVLSLAGFDPTGYEVKVDSTTITDLNVTVGDASLVILVKQVKGA